MTAGQAWVRARAGYAAAVLLVLALALLAAPTPPARAAVADGFSDTVVLSGLKRPTAIAFAPDERVFVAEKSGIVKVFDNLADTTPEVFANLEANVHSIFDRGLLGLAVHPSFPATPYVYVAYAHDAPIGGTAPTWSDQCGATYCTASGRLSRLTAAGNAMTGAEEVLIEDWCNDVPYHTVGGLRFGDDGALYMGGGEGASGGSHGEKSDPVNACGDPPAAVGGAMSPPEAEGGGLRAQDLRTPGDPVGLGGSIIRVDPNTGLGMPDNPLAKDPDANARRIVAYGFRNPYRFDVRPGTTELWVGDVGWETHEEFNRVPAVAGSARPANFGWPCYEGPGPQPGFQAKGLAICEGLYAEQTAVIAPAVTYEHGQAAFAGDGCGASDEGAASAVAFYRGGAYPDEYDNALFLGDYARGCLWVLRAGADGQPDPATIQTFASGIGPIVDLRTGPGGDLFYVDIYAGTVRRISYGAGDGEQAPAPSGPPPTVTISAPDTSTDWSVGETVNFAGSAESASGEPLPASALSWLVVLHHCYTPDQCHEHPYQSFDGVDQGSFAAPDHEYPAYLELRLDATDGAGQTGSATARIDPRTVDLTLDSEPGGLSLVVGGADPVATPIELTAIVGSQVSVSVPSPQPLDGTSYSFESWSDGGAQSHTIVAPTSATTYRATFRQE